jgi:hypothetical protein
MKKASVLLVLATLCTSLWASTTTLTGTITDTQGNGLNGTLFMTLPVPASDGTHAISPGPVTFQLVNGAITGAAQLYDVMTLQPSGLYYTAEAYDNAGNEIFNGNYVVTGASFNLGAATPTSVTTSNISYLTPTFASGNNVFSGANSFTGTNTFSGTLNIGATTTVTGGGWNFSAITPIFAALQAGTIQAASSANLTLATSGGTLQTNSTFSEYDNVALVGLGIPSEVQTVDQTLVQANISATTITNVSGSYRASCYIVETQAGTVSSTLPSCVFTWTDGDSGGTLTATITPTSASGNTKSTYGQGTVLIHTGATNVQYSTTSYASSGATPMQYAIHIRLEVM